MLALVQTEGISTPPPTAPTRTAHTLLSTRFSWGIGRKSNFSKKLGPPRRSDAIAVSSDHWQLSWFSLGSLTCLCDVSAKSRSRSNERAQPFFEGSPLYRLRSHGGICFPRPSFATPDSPTIASWENTLQSKHILEKKKSSRNLFRTGTCLNNFWLLEPTSRCQLDFLVWFPPLVWTRP